MVCPHCAETLTLDGGTLSCGNRHAFDVARQGYVNLLRGDTSIVGDTAPMVKARAAFLDAGHYASVVDALVRALRPGPGVIADIGAGVGYYLAAALDAVPDRVGLAVDVSKHASRRAARAHPRIGAAVCDARQPLPVRDGAVGLVLNVFAPRNPVELRRILHPEGVLVVVAPTARHLGELVSTLDLLTVEADKQSRIDEKLAAEFTLVGREVCDFGMALSREDVAALVGMGPNAFHLADDRAGRVADLAEPVRVTGSVIVSEYRPR
ncbi:MAG: 23S rRNA methyltransferase [Actinomycetota bacterium]|nr:23S rRNA methyltransferase [Actinomycetota bacterium]